MKNVRSSRMCYFEPLEHRTMLALTPVSITVSGSDWDGSFQPAGHTLISGQTLPWINLNEVSIRFSEAAIVKQDYLALTGVKVKDYLFSDFAYDAATHTATWKFDKPLGSDKLLIHLVDAVHGAAGAMDGDKDGNAGGDLMLRFNVQPGDVDGDGRTNIIDKIRTRNRSGTLVGQSGYSAFHDVDGSGDIRSSDIRLVKSELSTELPTGEPTKSQRPLVELSSNRIQSGRTFDVLVHRGPPRAPVSVLLHHDGPNPFEGGITDDWGKARITLQMPNGLIPSGALEDGFRLRVSVGDNPSSDFAVTVTKETEVFLTPPQIEEGEEFRIYVARGVGHSVIDVNVYHDGPEPVHEYGFLESDANGNAEIVLKMPFNLVKSAANEDGFRIEVHHGGVPYNFPVTIIKGQDISISPPDRIRELDTFNVRVERGVGHSQIDVDLWNDTDLVHEFEYAETDADGNANISFKMPHGLVTGAATEDGFRLRIGHGGHIKEIPITVLRGVTIAISKRNIKLGDSFTLLIERGKGEALIEVKIYHDEPEPVYTYPFMETDGSGRFDRALTIPADLRWPNGGTNEDGFRIRVLHVIDVSFAVGLKRGGEPPDPGPLPIPIPGPGLPQPDPGDPYTPMLPPIGRYSEYLGVDLDTPLADGSAFECVGAARRMSWRVNGTGFRYLGASGGAADLWDDPNHPSLPGFRKVAFSPGVRPSEGALLIWKRTPGNGNFGHVAVVLGMVDANTVRVVDSNWGLDGKGQIRDVDLTDAIYGWFDPL